MIPMFNTHKLPRSRRLGGVLGAVVTLAMTVAACTNPGAGAVAGTETPDYAGDDAAPLVTVATSFYPLEFVAREVGGDRVSVTNLTPPAADPHDLELTLAAANQLSTADLVMILGGFQPAVDQAVAARNPSRLIDAADYVDLIAGGHSHDDGHSHDADHSHDDDSHDADEHSHDDEADEDEAHEEVATGHAHSHDIGGYDPHFWLDPLRLASLAEPVAAALSEVDPDSANYFAANAADFTARLTELDDEFTAGLAPFVGAKMVTNHEAFGYLAYRFGLDQVGISGLDPEIEPSPARLREIGEIVRANNVNAIFYETLISPRVAQTLASDLGINAVVLNTLEGLTAEEQAAGEDYFSIMRTNLATLKDNLQ